MNPAPKQCVAGVHVWGEAYDHDKNPVCVFGCGAWHEGLDHD